jgi:hypothetical protein
MERENRIPEMQCACCQQNQWNAPRSSPLCSSGPGPDMALSWGADATPHWWARAASLDGAAALGAFTCCSQG